jgi:CBS domain-containing protein
VIVGGQTGPMSEPTGAGAMPVSALIADAIARIRPDATLLEVADALAAGDVGALVVGDDDKPAGIVSERDLVSASAGRRPFETTTALEVASTELVWCEVTATVAEVAEEMCERYVRHVLVEKDGRLVGIVSARDLLGAYAAADMELEP